MSFCELIESDKLRLYWPEVLPYLNKVLDYNDGYGLMDLKESLEEGKMDLWVHSVEGNTVDGVSVCYTIDYPRHREYFIFLTCARPGTYSMMKDDGDLAYKERARSLGCVTMSCQLRKGISHILKNLDYEEKYTIFQKRLG